MIKLIVSAPAKVILHGEHSVVYGRLALAASLGLRTRVELTEIDSLDSLIVRLPKIQFEYKFSLETIKQHFLNTPLPTKCHQQDYNWENPEGLDQESLSEKIEIFLKNLVISLNSTQLIALKAFFFLFIGILASNQIQLEPLLLVIDSQLQLGGGTGSSASYAVALSSILVQFVKKKADKRNFSKSGYKNSFWNVDVNHLSPKELEMICDWSFNAEKIVHGTPSGIDNTICTYGGLVEFRRGLPPKIMSISVPLKMLLVSSNIPRETKTQIGKVQDLHKKYPDMTNNILNAMEDVTFAALQQFQGLSNAFAVIPPPPEETIYNHYEELGRLATINHNLLAALGVSHPKLEEIILILAQFGLHGKLTGAGGGGYAIATIPPQLEAAVLENLMGESC